MSDIADRYRRAAGRLTALIAAVPPARWDDPSPCEGWSARDVLGHVLDTHRSMPERAGIAFDPWPDPAVDPAGAWASASGQMTALLTDADRAATAYESMFGPTTIGAVIDQFVTFDVIVHAWDIARATGGDTTMDPAEVPAMLAMARDMGDRMRVPGGMGPEVPVADDADDQTKLLGLLGRRA
jgi:uncharacterized protein (TIGR03086 family)